MVQLHQHSQHLIVCLLLGLQILLQMLHNALTAVQLSPQLLEVLLQLLDYFGLPS